jgi:TRAP-type C4-dicarboxylate transport system substrate-binding protein
VGVGWITANKDFLSGLKTSYRKKIIRALDDASELATQQIIDGEAELLGSLQAQGMTITFPDTEAIRTKAEAAVNALFETKYPVTTWEEVLAQ